MTPPPKSTDRIAAAYAGHLHTWRGVPNPAGVVAYQLQAELWQTHRAEVHHGNNLALVSVVTELVCLTDGISCWWWTGRTSPQGRRVYTYFRIAFLETAARRVAGRYAELLQAEEEGTRPGPAAALVVHSRPLAEVSR